MSLSVKCKCGVFTDNGFLCTSCQKNSSMDTLCYSPEETEELDEHGFTVVESLEEYNENDYEEED